MSYEYVGSIHLHTTSSDGAASHEEACAIASQRGLDFLIVTDHNVLVQGKDAWYGDLLLLVGEEIHDTRRVPEANHYLAFDIQEDVFSYASSPQAVIDAVNAQGGFGFIAHPFEHSPPFTGEAELPWLDWGATGYAGLEIWNYMSEFKSYLHNLRRALLFIFFPAAAITGPFPETLAKWDELLKLRRTTAIAGTDVHGNTYKLGPLRRPVLSYDHCFRALRTHVLTPEAFSGELEHDKALVYDALKNGHGFVAYDAIGDARGFSFTAQGPSQSVGPGQEIVLGDGVQLDVLSPLPAQLCLIKDGQVVAQTEGRALTHKAESTGVYRLETCRRHLLKRRGWVFTNPIYVIG
jgi:hypothetical protein